MRERHDNHFQSAIAAFENVVRSGGEHLDGLRFVDGAHIAEAEMRIDSHLLTSLAPQEPPYRHAEGFAEYVPERNLDAGNGAGSDCAEPPKAVLLHDPHEHLDVTWIASDHQRRYVLDCGRDRSRLPFERRLSPAEEPGLIGVDAHEDPISHLGMDDHRADFCNFHPILLRTAIKGAVPLCARLRRLPESSRLVLGDDYRHDQENAFGHHLEKCRHAGQNQPIIEHADNENAEQTANDRSFSARQRASAEHRGRYGLQLQTLGAGYRLPGPGAGGKEHPGHSRRRAAQSINTDLVANDVETRQAGDKRIAADRVDVAPDDRVAHENEENGDHDREHDDRNRYAEDLPVSDVAKSWIENADRLSV